MTEMYKDAWVRRAVEEWSAHTTSVDSAFVPKGSLRQRVGVYIGVSMAGGSQGARPSPGGAAKSRYRSSSVAPARQRVRAFWTAHGSGLIPTLRFIVARTRYWRCAQGGRPF